MGPHHFPGSAFTSFIDLAIHAFTPSSPGTFTGSTTTPSLPSGHHRHHVEDVQPERLVARDPNGGELPAVRVPAAAFRHQLPGRLLVHRHGGHGRPGRFGDLLPAAILTLDVP